LGTHFNTYTHTHTHTYSNSHSYGHTNTDSVGNGDAYADTDAYANPEAYTNAEVYAVTKGSPDPAASSRRGLICRCILLRLAAEFKLQKRSQLFIRSHNETLSVAVRVSNPGRSPVGIHG